MGLSIWGTWLLHVNRWSSGVPVPVLPEDLDGAISVSGPGGMFVVILIVLLIFGAGGTWRRRRKR